MKICRPSRDCLRFVPQGSTFRGWAAFSCKNMIRQTLRDAEDKYELDAYININSDVVLTLSHLASGDEGLNVFEFEGLSDLDWLIMKLTSLRGHFAKDAGSEN